jgi:hypothetical protein
MAAAKKGMTLQEFSRRFRKIRKMGFVRSTRRGPTGIGHTLETLLGISENNIASPDLRQIELKAHRSGSNNLITLFTFNRKAWQMPPLKAVKLYGSKDKDGRIGLYYTMGLEPNSAGLFLHVEEEKIAVRHISGEIVATWSLEDLAEQFANKVPALMLVSAHTELRDGIEYFHYS